MIDEGKLPGSSPFFHEARFYMTPVVYRGQEILGYVASCKEERCGWSQTFSKRITRQEEVDKHRREKAVAARFKYFFDLLKDLTQASRQVVANLDKHTATFATWQRHVFQFMDELAGGVIAEEERPDFKYEVNYHLGRGAMDTAKEALDKAYEIHPKN